MGDRRLPVDGAQQPERRAAGSCAIQQIEPARNNSPCTLLTAQTLERYWADRRRSTGGNGTRLYTLSRSVLSACGIGDHAERPREGRLPEPVCRGLRDLPNPALPALRRMQLVTDDGVKPRGGGLLSRPAQRKAGARAGRRGAARARAGAARQGGGRLRVSSAPRPPGGHNLRPPGGGNEG